MKAVVLLVISVAACGAVLDSSASGFTVRTTLTINAASTEVYQRLIHNIGEWWNPAHTFSQDAHNLRIEDHPGGCLCEKLPNDGFVRHFELINLAPNKRVVFSGALGPLQSLAATGTMQIQLSAVEGGTKFEVTYTVAGYTANGMNSWAAPVDAVTGEQFTRLKRYVETGSAAPVK
jgi:hypothetical protein